LGCASISFHFKTFVKHKHKQVSKFPGYSVLENPVTETKSEQSRISAVDEQGTIRTQTSEAKSPCPEYKAITDCTFQRLPSAAEAGKQAFITVS
jgi:hypothetical protein